MVTNCSLATRVSFLVHQAAVAIQVSRSSSSIRPSRTTSNSLGKCPTATASCKHCITRSVKFLPTPDTATRSRPTHWLLHNSLRRTDYGKYKQDEVDINYINRWHLQKRDPSLRISPPVEPIRFYIEHTTPVRYRRWVKQGIEFWNKAF